MTFSAKKIKWKVHRFIPRIFSRFSAVFPAHTSLKVYDMFAYVELHVIVRISDRKMLFIMFPGLAHDLTIIKYQEGKGRKKIQLFLQ